MKALYKALTKYNDFTSDDMLNMHVFQQMQICKIAAGKIDEIIKQTISNRQSEMCVFGETNDSTEIKNFFIECKIEALDYTVISRYQFLSYY
jgi:hypothetical protein